MEKEININNVLSDGNARVMAEEFFKDFSKNADSTNLDFDFSINKGAMVSESVNTKYAFNSKTGSFTESFIKSVKEVSDHENFQSLFKDFLDKLIYNLNKKYKDEIRKVVRKVVLGDAEEFLFPIKNIKVVNVEINHAFEKDGDGGYVLQIEKKAPKGYISKRSVAAELIQGRINTGKSYEELLEEGKKTGYLDYVYVTGYSKKYYETEFFIGIYADYSPAPYDDVKKVMKR